MEINIRPENEKEFSTLYILNQLAFNQENESILIDKIRLSKSYIPKLCLVAEVNRQIVGHIVFSTNHIDSNNTLYESLALAPMAVHPDFQKKGIGSKMIRTAITNAKSLGFSSINVLGHPEYYPGFGFKESTFWGIKCPFDVSSEAFMCLELQKGSLERKSGTVIYSQAFYDCL